MSDVLFWAAGNLILPLFPVLVSAVVLKVVSRPVDAHSALEDGVLFFYTATIAAVFLTDVCRRLMSGARTPQLATTVAVILAVLLLLVSVAGFAFAALGRAGGRDVDGGPLKLGWLSTMSWISALATAILVLIGRSVVGLM